MSDSRFDDSLGYSAASASDTALLWEMLAYAAAIEGPIEAAVARAQHDTGLRLTNRVGGDSLVMRVAFPVVHAEAPRRHR